MEHLKNIASYYGSSGARELAHKVKVGDIEAVQEMAAKLAPIISKGYFLIPIPNRSGSAITTMQLALEISKITGNPIVDIIKGKNRKSLYEIKKEGGCPDSNFLGFYLNGEKPEKAILLDTVYATGRTMYEASRLLPYAEAVV